MSPFRLFDILGGLDKAVIMEFDGLRLTSVTSNRTNHATNLIIELKVEEDTEMLYHYSETIGSFINIWIIYPPIPSVEQYLRREVYIKNLTLEKRQEYYRWPWLENYEQNTDSNYFPKYRNF